MSEWYYAHNDEPLGPISDDLFYQLRTTGTIDPETLVWREGMSDWLPLAQIPDMSGPPPTARRPVSATRESGADRGAEPDSGVRCVECGGEYGAEDMVHYEADRVCATCKPVYFQRLRESGATPCQMRYGGFWIRAAAALIDGVIMYVVSWPIMRLEQWTLDNHAPAGDTGEIAFSVAVASVFILVSFVPQVAYDAFFVGRFAATPGKMMLGLRVVRSDGGRVSYLRAVGRSLASLLSFFTLCIGFLIAAFDREKRTLHDHICDTRVVYK